MNILLINPNTMQNPPVIPIGLEYILTALEKHNHNTDILDLTFEPNPDEVIKKRLETKSYDLVGFTIRNIDSSVFYNNQFYLPDIKNLVNIVRRVRIPVVLGGAGFSAMPHDMLDYFQADYGIIGPAENILPKFIDLLQSGKVTQKI